MAVKFNSNINGYKYNRKRKRSGEALDGTVIYKNFYGTSDKDSATKKREWEMKRSLGVKEQNEHFGRLMEYWMNNVFLISSRHSDGTKNRYLSAYNKFIKKSELFFMNIQDIDSPIIQQYYNALASDGYNVATINKILRLFYFYAEAGRFCINPLVNIVIPKISTNKRKDGITVFTRSEIEKIVTSNREARNATYRMLYLFALGTGLRMGELLGLKWSDIRNGSVYVTRQVVYNLEKELVLSDTKSENSVRSVPIPKYVMAELKQYKKGCSEFIFTTENGKFIDKASLRTSYTRFLRSLEIPYKSFHTFRATYCTMLCQSGVEIEVASKLLGHSSIAVTAKYYAFISNEMMLKAVQKYNDFISDIF